MNVCGGWNIFFPVRAILFSLLQKQLLYCLNLKSRRQL